MNIDQYLDGMIKMEASDIYFSSGAAASVKVHGAMQAVDEKVLTKDDIKALAYGMMDDKQQKEFEGFPEMNLAIALENIGRFRVNIFKQRGDVAMVIRHINTEVPTVEDMKLPQSMLDLIMNKRGLFLMVGATGSGKSTSLAALIDYRNRNSAGHIITIEDPIEFVHPHKKSIINQREVGADTESYEDALKNTLRQAPDVILIGEIRSQETMEHAIAFAETGHLCISTLHANNANQALDRIINFFPEERRQQLLLDLSLNMRGIVSQRLIPTVDKKRCAAIEILLGTPRVCDLIKQSEISMIKETMEASENLGMRTFDSALYHLYKDGKITLEEAMKNADSENNLRLRIELEEKGGGELLNKVEDSGLSLKSDDEGSQ